MTRLIFCAGSNQRYATIATKHGFYYGARLPVTLYYQPYFVDQNWKKPDRAKYMAALRDNRPAIATVLDWEQPEQLPEVLDWANEAAQYVTDSVIIIPKVIGGVKQLPRIIAGKPVRLGYSVPTTHGGTKVKLTEFIGWPIHLLGGSPIKQLEIMGAKEGDMALEAGRLDVRSADNNYIIKQANANRFFANAPDFNFVNRYWPQLAEVRLHPDSDTCYMAFELSIINMKSGWLGCRAMIRYGINEDIPAIRRIAQQHSKELGYVMYPALRQSIQKYELFVAVADRQVVGFCRWHKRRDEWSTIYELAVHRDFQGHNIGRALLEAVPAPRRLKCTIENPANYFYADSGMTLDRVEAGKHRQLNVWVKRYTRIGDNVAVIENLAESEVA